MSSVPEALRTKLSSDSSPEAVDGRRWQREMAGAVRSVEELLKRVGLNPAGEPLEILISRLGMTVADCETLRRFPVLVPDSYLNRMVSGDASDPLLRQVLPLGEESLSVNGFVADPVGDAQARRAPGALQKYSGRVLLIATHACAVHCRYCFRRDYPYASEPRSLDDWQPALTMIANDASITEVIFSGGDPLMLSDARLRILCEAVDGIPHVERIRFHTRLPIVLPSRLTCEFLSLLEDLRAQTLVVVHANHGNEIAGDCLSALRSLVRAGVPVLNQAVLLRGINDTVDALEDLCRRLINVGVMPYYLSQLDRVAGTSHFEVEEEVGTELIRQLAMRLPGYGVPRFVKEIPGESSKSPISSKIP